MKRSQKKYKRKCKICGKIVSLPEYRKDSFKYCSKKCHIKEQRKNQYQQPCHNCGKVVIVDWNKKSKNVYCNPACYKEKKAARIKTKCAGCNIDMVVYKSRLEYYSKVYCSQNCYHSNTIKKHMQTLSPDWKVIRTILCSTSRYLKWRKSVISRDNNKCKCGATKNLRVHHKELLYNIARRYNPTFSILPKDIKLILDSKEFNDVSNGETLCISCHLSVHIKPL